MKNQNMRPRFLLQLWMGVLVVGMLVSACSFPGDNSAGTSTPTPGSSQGGQHAPAKPLPPHKLADKPVGASNVFFGRQVDPNTTVPLVFTLPYNDAALQQYLEQLYSPGSPQYHHFLTPQQLATQYALPNSQVQLVMNWLSQNGYTQLSLDASHSSIHVQATEATIERTLKTPLNTFAVLGRQFFMQKNDPVLPATISPYVQSIVGLNDFASPVVKPPSNAAHAAKDCSGYGANQSLTRNKLAAAYQIDQLYKQGLQGQGMNIGVAEFNEPFDPHDVANYAACAGIGTPNIQTVNVDGVVPPGPGESEAAMDVELIAGLAPRAHITVYQGYYTGTTYESFAISLYDVFNRVATDHKVQVLSVSYGVGEEEYSTVDMYAISDVVLHMAAEGISVFISSGDCGAYSLRVPGIASVSFPASSPYAISVGGTHLVVNDHNIRTQEDVWRDNTGNSCHNQWGSGGGVSQTPLFKRPKWQVGSGTTAHFNGGQKHVSILSGGPVSAPNGLRQVPDVSAAAYPNISIYYTGLWYDSGGTSAAAPIWAAGALLVDQGLLQHHKSVLGAVPEMYTLANHAGHYHPYVDIVQGDNLFYPATRGWDYTTGWGSPQFNDILHLKLTM